MSSKHLRNITVQVSLLSSPCYKQHDWLAGLCVHVIVHRKPRWSYVWIYRSWNLGSYCSWIVCAGSRDRIARDLTIKPLFEVNSVHHWLMWLCVLVLARVEFCSSQKGAWLGRGGYSIPPHVTFGGWGKRLSFRLGSTVEEVVRYSRRCDNSHANHSFFVHSFIIAAVTVHFLILFPVNCYYLNLWSLCFVSPILFFILLQGHGGGGAEGSECHMLCSVSVEVLNWGTPFLKPWHYDTLCCYICGQKQLPRIYPFFYPIFYPFCFCKNPASQIAKSV